MMATQTLSELPTNELRRRRDDWAGYIMFLMGLPPRMVAGRNARVAVIEREIVAYRALADEIARRNEPAAQPRLIGA